ncbi:unnamed protein product [Heterobilharzia americana]|nr:unnamed protein product [Heterobilharzia americana]
MSNDADEHEAKTTDSYKRTISYESGIHSSSCQDGSEFMRASDVPTFERIHSENTKEKKPSQSPTSTCSLSSNGTFSASSSDSEVSQSMSRDHFKSKCNDNAAPSIECNCSCHRRDSGNNNAASLHVSSTSVSSRQRQRRDYQDSIVGSTNVGHVDKMNSRLASPYNLVPNSEWDAGRRSSESYTKQQKTKEKMHALNDGQSNDFFLIIV